MASRVILAQDAPPPAVPQDGAGRGGSLLGQKYESLNDLKDDLTTRGPSEHTYNDLFEMVGPDNEDSAREALASFFQGSATAVARIYEMLVAAGKAAPIDSELVGAIMEQHPELNQQEGAATASSDGTPKYAGLFLPCNSCGLMTKTADSAAFPHYPPADAPLRMCPKTRTAVPLEICRYHCLDGIVVDDTQVLCGEAIWRQNVMDKFSREYRDKDGNWVGGYLNKRFKTEYDDGGHPALLPPGQRSAPIHEDAWSTEKRLQELRRSEATSRGYSKTPGDPRDVYEFDQYKDDKGPKNPQAFEKKQDPKSTTAFNLRETRRASLVTANPVIDPAMQDMSPKVKVCPKCHKNCAVDAVACDMCRCPLKGNPAATDMNSQQIQGETGSIGQSGNIMAGVDVSESLGVYKATSRGASAFASTPQAAIRKLAQSLADLQPDSIETQNNELGGLIQDNTFENGLPGDPGLPGQPEAHPHDTPPPDGARVDMTPSTPGVPAVDNPVPDEVQGGVSEFGQDQGPQADEGDGHQGFEPEAVETGEQLVGKTFPMGDEGWNPGDGHHIDAGDLDQHIETDNHARHPGEVSELHDQAFNSGAAPAF